MPENSRSQESKLLFKHYYRTLLQNWWKKYYFNLTSKIMKIWPDLKRQRPNTIQAHWIAKESAKIKAVENPTAAEKNT